MGRTRTSWAKGKPKTGGRQKGVRNKATVDLKLFWREFFESEAYRQNLTMRMARGAAPHMESYLHALIYGKPVEHLELTGKDGGAIQVQEVAQAHEQFRERMLRLVKGGNSHEGDGDGVVGDGAVRQAAG